MKTGLKHIGLNRLLDIRENNYFSLKDRYLRYDPALVEKIIKWKKARYTEPIKTNHRYLSIKRLRLIVNNNYIRLSKPYGFYDKNLIDKELSRKLENQKKRNEKWKQMN